VCLINKSAMDLALSNNKSGAGSNFLSGSGMTRQGPRRAQEPRLTHKARMNMPYLSTTATHPLRPTATTSPDGAREHSLLSYFVGTGARLERTSTAVGRSGVRSWLLLGCSWPALGRSWGPSWAVSGCSWTVLGGTCGPKTQANGPHEHSFPVFAEALRQGHSARAQLLAALGSLLGPT